MSALDFVTPAGQQVRTVTIDGEPWFVAADVSSILGYRMASDLTRRLQADEKGTRSVRTPGGEQPMTVISEPGLYMAILGSQVPHARNFQRWVTHEVLPAIRKTGQFGSAMPTDFAEALELAAVEVRKVLALEAQAAIDAPKVAAFDALMDADGYYPMEQAAKVLGMGRTTLYNRLRDAGVIQRGSTTPYQRYMHHFVITVGTWADAEGVKHPTHTTRLRPSGLPFVRQKLGLEVEALT